MRDPRLKVPSESLVAYRANRRGNSGENLFRFRTAVTSPKFFRPQTFPSSCRFPLYICLESVSKRADKGLGEKVSFAFERRRVCPLKRKLAMAVILFSKSNFHFQYQVWY